MRNKLKEKAAQPLVTSTEWDGTTIYFRRVDAKKWLSIRAKLEAAAKAEGRDGLGAESTETVDYYRGVLLLCSCDENGKPDLMDEEGKVISEAEADLKTIPFFELQRLAEFALVHNGASHEKN